MPNIILNITKDVMIPKRTCENHLRVKSLKLMKKVCTSINHQGQARNGQFKVFRVIGVGLTSLGM